MTMLSHSQKAVAERILAAGDVKQFDMVIALAYVLAHTINAQALSERDADAIVTITMELLIEDLRRMQLSQSQTAGRG